MNLLTKSYLIYRAIIWRLTWEKRDVNYLPPDLPPKFMTALDAVRLIPDGAHVMSSGMAASTRCTIFFWALRELFLTTGHPRDLFWMHVGAAGGRSKLPGTIEDIALPGLITRFLTGHHETIKAQHKLADQGLLELLTMPQGVMTFLLEDQGRGVFERVSDTGVGTFLDPRVGSGSQVIPGVGDQLIRAEGDQLRYTMPRVEFSMCSLPYADLEGNVYAENACMITESVESARAAKANGGKVMVAVADIIPQDPGKILIPSEMIDAIVVNPRNEQTGGVPQKKYWDILTVNSKYDVSEGAAQLKFINETVKITPHRGPSELAMARMAADLFSRTARPGSFVNIGVGLPEEVCRIIYEEGLSADVTFATETGVYGGLPAPGIYFGAAVNPQKIMSSAQVFHEFYDRLDVTILGLLEADSDGNVNVSKRGPGAVNYVGPGGFPDLVRSAKTIIFVGGWMAGGKLSVRDGRLYIDQPGRHKFMEHVDQITFNGKRALELGKQVFYVTNIGVFRLTPEGMELIEVMPGVDVKQDVIEACPMKLRVSADLKLTRPEVVTGKDFKLTWQ